MEIEDFLLLTESAVAEHGLPVLALWWEARGEWDKAHEVAQEAADKDGDWVHAYLHRVEADEGNAGYWYARAGRRPPEAGTSFEAERAAMLAELWKQAATGDD